MSKAEEREEKLIKDIDHAFAVLGDRWQFDEWFIQTEYPLSIFHLGPVLQNNFDAFYQDTEEIPSSKSIDLLESELDTAVLEYKWKDSQQ